MRHLAIECSALSGSISLLDGPIEQRSLTLDCKTGSVQGLAVLIKDILSGDETTTVPPSLISVTSGPGSFTGLRVGLATAKSLAFAWNIPVVAVDTLHAIARRAANEFAFEQAPYLLVTVINAFRKQVFAAGWQVDPTGSLVWRKSSQVVDASLWKPNPWESLSEPTAAQDRSNSSSNLTSLGSHQTLRVSGPGLRNFSPEISARSEVVSPEWWEPRSIEVGQIGWEKFQLGEFSNATTLAANYIRSSAAEEKRRS